MSEKAQKKRDKEITRHIHKLFRESISQDKWGGPICWLARVPAFALIHVFMPLSTAYALNAIISRDFDKVDTYVWQILLQAVGFGILWFISSLAITRNGVVSGAYIQEKALSSYLSKDYEFYGSTYLGALSSQAIRLRQALVNEYNIVFFLMVPKQVVVIAGGILVIGFYSIPLAAITLVTMAAVLSFTILSGRWRLKWRRQVSDEENAVAGSVSDALTHAPAVKSFASEKHEVERLRKSLKPWQRTQRISWLTSVPADIGRYLLVATATALLLVATASMYKDGTISLVIVTLVQLYVIKMIAATVDINEIVKTYESAMGGAYQPVITMMTPTTVNDMPDATELLDTAEYSVSFNDVTFHYNEALSGVAAIRDLDLQIKPGEKIGLVGYSGSGKSTLTKLLLRYVDLKPDDGQIEVAGQDIRSLKQNSLREHITYVPQEPILFHRSVYENIAYGRPGASRKDILEAAKLAHVDEFVQDLPQKYDTLVGERGVKLSGGQRQRVVIARAILKHAPIIVLDEATSALDSESEKLIQDALWKLMKQRTALVIAHRLSTIQRMDRIVVMDKGEIAQVGTHEELLKDSKGIYAQLWKHQSGGYIGLPDEDEDETE